ncbi:MAG TPA: hypothetical protein VGR45_15090 [Stellaceae bacterium]|nr:hypothetical protein [Stellaceae bacterium]
MSILIGTKGPASLDYPFNIYPLRVIKQVSAMFLSVNHPNFRLAHTDLVRFILNKESMEFPCNISIYAFYTISNRMRRSGVSVVAKGMGGPNGSMHAFSELTFPPFGFVMTFDNQAPIEQGFAKSRGSPISATRIGALASPCAYL